MAYTNTWDDDERSSKFVSVRPSQVNTMYIDSSIGKVLKDIATNNYSNHFNKNIPEYDYGYCDYYCVSSPPFYLYDQEQDQGEDQGDDYENTFELDDNGDNSDAVSPSETSGSNTALDSNQTTCEVNTDTKDDNDVSEANPKMIDDIMYKKFCYC